MCINSIIMKKTVQISLSYFFLLTLILVSCSPLTKSAEKRQASVRILSYNVRNCRGLDNVTDYKRVADIITRISPDVVALQELDSATTRSAGIVVLNELARYTNMFESYSASITFQGGKYGIGVLSKVEPMSMKVVPLPGREENRSMLVVEFKDYIFCCTHFSLTEEDRAASVSIINDALKGNSKPVFLAGDLNSVPGSSVIKSIETGWYMLNNPQVPTIPADNPQKCIDFIFAAKFNRHTFQTKQTTVEHEPLASDHLPVWADILIN
jgi:endonuclease/exonuclease/phosphatase family metal-dependent hydrolase